jgi:ubiquinone/menaquinone biosynthesis C-methylase UbiE
MPQETAEQAGVPARQRAEVDWDRAADRPQASALPPLMPPARALLGNLPALAGGVILDLGCGLGSSTFQAARQNPGTRLLGVDRAGMLIGAARSLAAAHAIGNAEFEVMSLDALALPDKSVDAAISHFAFLHEGDVAVSVRELSRVLKDGAPYSVVAWDAMELNTLVSRTVQVLERHVPAELLPNVGYLNKLATPGLREQLLREAGFSALHTELFSWQLPVPSAAVLIAAPVPFGPAVDSLASSELEIVRNELEQEAADFRAADGTYTFPMACRLYWGSK